MSDAITWKQCGLKMSIQKLHPVYPHSLHCRRVVIIKQKFRRNLSKRCNVSGGPLRIWQWRFNGRRFLYLILYVYIPYLNLILISLLQLGAIYGQRWLRDLNSGLIPLLLPRMVFDSSKASLTRNLIWNWYFTFSRCNKKCRLILC